jgi:hypothetical protein
MANAPKAHDVLESMWSVNRRTLRGPWLGPASAEGGAAYFAAFFHSPILAMNASGPPLR